MKNLYVLTAVAVSLISINYKAYAAETTSLGGPWIFEISDGAVENAPKEEKQFTATIAGKTILFENEDVTPYPFTATFDEATNTLTFARTLMTAYSPEGTHLYQEPSYWGGFMFLSGNITATYDANSGTLTFNEDQPGISWILYNQEENEWIGGDKTYLFYGAHKTDDTIVETIDSAVEPQKEYYTLDGTKISEPEGGTIVIERQGSMSRKIFVKTKNFF